MRVLEDHLHTSANGSPCASPQGEHLAAVERDAAGSGRDQAEDRARQRGLARAGFADQAERLAAYDVEAHAVDRLDLAGAAASQIAR